MTTFFIDLWQDLRERRLWPVAVGLIAAIVAVPAVLFKPASDAAPGTTVAPRTDTANTLPVVSVQSGPTTGSKLEAFNEKNPFKPMKDLAKTTTSGDKTATAPAPTGSGGGDTTATPASSGGGVPSSGSPGNSGTTPGSSGGTPSGVDPSGPSVQWFRYAADFSFGETGKLKKYEGPESYTLLPDEKSPAVVFIGVTDDGKSAVFMIADPGFQAVGEGDCAPKGDACQFVTLSLGDSADEETFTAVDGSKSYDVKLNRIRREKIAADANGNPKPKVPVTPKTTGKPLEATDAGVDTATEASQSVVPDLVVSGPGFAREQR